MSTRTNLLAGGLFLVILGLGLTSRGFGQTTEDLQVTPAVVPQTMVFSGSTPSRAGERVEIEFRIYSAEQGGEPLWSETQQVAVGRDGKYTVLLGSAGDAGLPQGLFASGQARWLGVSCGGGAEQPRSVLSSVPYAMKAADAESLAGHSAADFVTQAQWAARARAAATRAQAAPADSTANLSGTGTANAIPLWTGNATLGNSIIYQPDPSSVEIGSASQAATLDVNGAATVRGTLSLAAIANATPANGASSPPLEWNASAWSSSSAAAQTETFAWAATPSGNNSAAPSANLQLLFASGSNPPAPTGLSIAPTGIVTFAGNQTFPVPASGPGSGTISSVAAGAGLTGGGALGGVTLAVDAAKVPMLASANKFTAPITAPGFTGPLTGNVTGTASGNLPLSGGKLAGALTAPAFIDSHNVKYFGVTGNGTTDDTKALQTAILAQGAGGSLYLPCGTYLISSALVVNQNGLTILGQGVGCAIIQLKPGTTTDALDINPTSMVNHDMRLSSFVIRDLQIVGVPGSGAGISLNYLASGSISNVWVLSMGGDGIRSFQTTGFTLSNIHASYNFNGIALGQQSDSFSCISCQLSRNLNWGLYEGAYGSPNGSNNGPTLIGGTVSNNGSASGGGGIWISGTRTNGVNLLGVYMENNYNYHLLVGSPTDPIGPASVYVKGYFHTYTKGLAPTGVYSYAHQMLAVNDSTFETENGALATGILLKVSPGPTGELCRNGHTGALVMAADATGTALAPGAGSCMTIPGTPSPGTITAINTTSPLTGSGTAGAVALALNLPALESTLNGQYAQLAAANTFSGNQTIQGNLTVTGTINGACSGTGCVASAVSVPVPGAGLIESLTAGNTSFVGNGSLTANSGAAVTNVNATPASPYMLESASASSAGSWAGWAGQGRYIWSHQPKLSWGFQLPSASDYSQANSTRIMMGLWMETSAGSCTAGSSVANTDSPFSSFGCQGAMIRFSNAASDKSYMCIAGNGATQTAAAIAGATPSSAYTTASISVGATGVTCTVGSNSATAQTVLPASAVMEPTFANVAQSGAPVHLNLGWVYGVSQNGAF
jgi:hypothetical protein